MSCKYRRGQIWAVPVTSLLLGGCDTVRAWGPLGSLWSRLGGHRTIPWYPSTVTTALHPPPTSDAARVVWGPPQMGQGAGAVLGLLP